MVLQYRWKLSLRLFKLSGVTELDCRRFENLFQLIEICLLQAPVIMPIGQHF